MLIIHIGFHKTGSSSIQHYCNAHREEIAKCGLGYPVPLCEYPSHAELAWAFLGDAAPWRDRDYSPEMVVGYYREIMARNERKGVTTLLSNEDISFIADNATQRDEFATAFRPFTPSILAYIRDPVDYAISLYHHAIIAGSTHLSFRDWMATGFSVEQVDFRRRIERWEAAFGSKSIIIREYERMHAVQSFLSLFKIDREHEEPRENLGIHPHFSDIYRQLPQGKEGDRARLDLQRDSAIEKEIDAAEFYLGREDADALKQQLRPPYQTFLALAKQKYKARFV